MLMSVSRRVEDPRLAPSSPGSGTRYLNVWILMRRTAIFWPQSGLSGQKRRNGLRVMRKRWS